MCLSVAIYLVFCLGAFLDIEHQTHRHFTYALDDPYIHMALAENLAHGHYGINVGEASSPSSSVLWPFLLIPFAGTSFHPYLPLVLNLLFGAAAAGLLGSIVSQQIFPAGESDALQLWKKGITVALLVLLANLTGLTFIGMEHTLQVLLAICCAFAVGEALQGRPISTWCLVAAALGPAVRYESLSITLAMVVLLLAIKRPRAAVIVMVAALLPLIGFSAFLHSRGLPLLPTSVLVKKAASTGAGVASTLFLTLRNAAAGLKNEPVRLPTFALLLIFLRFAWKEVERVRRAVFAGTAGVAALHLLIGRFGWFDRYEIYETVFLVLVFLYTVPNIPRNSFAFFAFTLLLLANLQIWIVLHIGAAAENIYSQQAQMHRFVTEFYRGNFAVNDLGQVSYGRPPNEYVLDLWGLGSYEAARQPNKDALWLQGMVERHHIPLVMIYKEWFPSIPSNWVHLGSMCTTATQIVAAGPCVQFYSTGPDSTQDLRQAVHRFAAVLPSQATFTFDPSDGR